MRYLLWTLLALAAYTFVAPLVNLASTDLPSTVVVLITNGILVFAAAVIVFLTQESVVPYLTASSAVYAYGAGLVLTVGILAYYRALSLGPVSLVVPVYGLFIVTSSAIGILFLDESLTARKLLGIGFAVLAVYLTSVE